MYDYFRVLQRNNAKPLGYSVTLNVCWETINTSLENIFSEKGMQISKVSSSFEGERGVYQA